MRSHVSAQPSPDANEGKPLNQNILHEKLLSVAMVSPPPEEEDLGGG